MPVSKNRGSRKDHRRRVKKRNINAANAQRQYEKIFTKAMEKQLENLNSEENATPGSEETSEN
jgi:hypothetical protein